MADNLEISSAAGGLVTTPGRSVATPGRTVAKTGRIVLADDHAVFLTGLREVLAERPHLEVVASASDGLGAIAAVKRHLPDVAVLDDSMPVATGLEVFAEVRRWSPQTRFVILTGRVAPRRMAEMTAMGVEGVLLKTMAPEAICDGIEAVLRGERVSHPEPAGGAFALTPREAQVLEGIARGMSNAAMAETLGVSIKTVDTHRMRLMRKMDARNIAGLLVSAIRHGLIDVT